MVHPLLTALIARWSALGLRSKILAIWLAFFGLAWLATGGPKWPLGVSLIASLISVALITLVGREQNRVNLLLPILALTAVVIAALLSPPHTNAELDVTLATFWPRFRIAFVLVSLLIPIYLGVWISLSVSRKLPHLNQHFLIGLGFIVLLGSLIWLLPLPWDWLEYFLGFP